MQDDEIDVMTRVEERAGNDGKRKHRRIDAVDASLVPIGEIGSTFKGFEKQREPRTEEEQHISQGSSYCQCPVIAIEQLHVRVGDKKHCKKLEDVNSYVTIFHFSKRSISLESAKVHRKTVF